MNCKLCGEYIPTSFVHRPNPATILGQSCRLVRAHRPIVDTDFERLLTCDIADIERDIARHNSHDRSVRP